MKYIHSWHKIKNWRRLIRSYCFISPANTQQHYYGSCYFDHGANQFNNLLTIVNEKWQPDYDCQGPSRLTRPHDGEGSELQVTFTHFV